jgi:RNA polymerase sigma-70 factor (ECF subfamily)
VHNRLYAQLTVIRERFQAAKRKVQLEQPLPTGDDSAASHVAPPAPSSARPDNILVTKEQRIILEMALEELSESDKQIICLRQKDGCDFLEIAQKLNMSLDAVKKRWVRAVQNLRKKVSRLYDLANE